MSFVVHPHLWSSNSFDGKSSAFAGDTVVTGLSAVFTRCQFVDCSASSRTIRGTYVAYYQLTALKWHLKRSITDTSSSASGSDVSRARQCFFCTCESCTGGWRSSGYSRRRLHVELGWIRKRYWRVLVRQDFSSRFLRCRDSKRLLKLLGLIADRHLPRLILCVRRRFCSSSLAPSLQSKTRPVAALVPICRA